MQTRHAKAPISAHPLFPAVVAVWFAALFGLGSGVLPNVLFERAITATGLASLIPSATPPLGATFRIMLSLTFALAGAALGFVLARRLAAAQYVERPASPVSRLAPKPDPRPSIDAKRRPISVKDELDDDTRLDPVKDEDDETYTSPIAGRRRSLALAEEERKSDFFTHRALPIAEEAMPQPAAPREEPMEQPLDLTSFASAEPVEDPVYVPQVEPRVEPESIVDRGLQGLRNRSPFAKPFGDEDEEPLDFAPPFAAAVADEASFAGEALPFSAPSQVVQPEPQVFHPVAEAAPAPEPEPAPMQVFQPAAPAPEPEPKQVFAAAAAAPTPVLPTDPTADLDDLGMVQLAERLAASLRSRLSRPASTPAFVAGLKADFGIEIEEVPEGIAPGSAIFGGAAFEPVAPDAPPPPPVIPAALRPLPYGFDEDEDEDDDGPIPSLSLPLAGFTAPAAFAADEEEEAEELGEAEENYSSLLAMKNPFHAPAEFVRVEEPEHDGEIEPAVVFPAADSAAPSFAAPGTPPAPVEAEPEATPVGEARPFDAPPATAASRSKPNPEETERALRSALATLQKMSGAA